MTPNEKEWEKVKQSLISGLSPDKAAALNMVMDNSRAAMKKKRDWFWMVKELKDRLKFLVGAKPYGSAFHRVLLPIIRRVMPQVIATDILGVQPMSAPAGQVFALRYKYGDPDDLNIHGRWRHEIMKVLHPIIRRVKLLWSIRYSKWAILRQYRLLMK